MEINDLLIQELTKPSENIEKVTVKYTKKLIISGIISKLQINPFSILLSTENNKSKEDGFHTINFAEAKQISIKFYDGRISVHQDSKYTD
ncbi:hypothetical protein [Chryseobacterium sp.]|uniref:hypothetical protein n=1 Tax=Chryseobacterium sp. TaxID=1871047 RepID=UPI002FC91CDE